MNSKKVTLLVLLSCFTVFQNISALEIPVYYFRGMRNGKTIIMVVTGDTSNNLSSDTTQAFNQIKKQAEKLSEQAGWRSHSVQLPWSSDGNCVGDFDYLFQWVDNQKTNVMVVCDCFLLSNAPLVPATGNSSEYFDGIAHRCIAEAFELFEAKCKDCFNSSLYFYNAHGHLSVQADAWESSMKVLRAPKSRDPNGGNDPDMSAVLLSNIKYNQLNDANTLDNTDYEQARIAVEVDRLVAARKTQRNIRIAVSVGVVGAVAIVGGAVAWQNRDVD